MEATMSERKAQVTSALAKYVQSPQERVLPGLLLKQDLGLEPLDLVVFVIAFRELDDSDFPFEALEQARIVSDLVTLVAAALEELDGADSLLDDDAPMTGHASGVWSAVRRAV